MFDHKFKKHFTPFPPEWKLICQTHWSPIRISETFLSLQAPRKIHFHNVRGGLGNYNTCAVVEETQVIEAHPRANINGEERAVVGDPN